MWDQKRSSAWVTFYDPCTKTEYARTSVTLWIRQERGIQVTQVFYQGVTFSIPNEVLQASGLKHLDSVFLVAEICHDNHGNFRPHPFRVARMPPKIGKNQLFEDIAALALRVEWSAPDGQWKTCWLEKRSPFELKPHGMLTMQWSALTIWTDIFMINWTGQAAIPSHQKRPVYEVRFWHLAQRFTMMQRRSCIQPWPADHGVTVNRQRLIDIFGNDPRVAIGQYNNHFASMRGQMSRRARCDLCYTTVSYTHIFVSLLGANT